MNKELANRLRQWLQNSNMSEPFMRDISEAADALDGTEQVRASEWPTEAMIAAAELKMPDLGRIQIRFLFETMLAAASQTRASASASKQNYHACPVSTHRG